MDPRPLMMMQVVAASPRRVGAEPHGSRIAPPITEGNFEGPRLRGRLLPGGRDWTLSRADSFLELDLRVTLDDGAPIHVTSRGPRHGPFDIIAALALGENVGPSAYYFGTFPGFELGHPKYEFLNRLLAVASGDRRPKGPIDAVDEIL
jgi:hypothetical protein